MNELSILHWFLGVWAVSVFVCLAGTLSGVGQLLGAVKEIRDTLKGLSRDVSRATERLDTIERRLSR